MRMERVAGVAARKPRKRRGKAAVKKHARTVGEMRILPTASAPATQPQAGGAWPVPAPTPPLAGDASSPRENKRLRDSPPNAPSEADAKRARAESPPAAAAAVPRPATWRARPADIASKRSLTSSSTSTATRCDKLELCSALGDGNCLFRAVSTQVYGDQDWHDRVRAECMDFIAKDRAHFREFIAGDFDEYVRRKRLDGCFGDNPEIQAMAELYNRPVVVYEEAAASEAEDQVVNVPGRGPVRVRQLNIFHSELRDVPIRLFYQGQSHYDAIVDPHKATVGVGLGLAGFKPGLADESLIKSVARQSELESSEAELFKLALRQSLEDAWAGPLQNKKRRRGKETALAAAAAGERESAAVRELVVRLLAFCPMAQD